MNLTPRNRDECDFDLEEWEWPKNSGQLYSIVGVIAVPEGPWDDEGVPKQEPARVAEITQVQVYNEAKQGSGQDAGWEDSPEALARFQSEVKQEQQPFNPELMTEFHRALIEEFWNQCEANEEKRQEDMQDRR